MLKDPHLQALCTEAFGETQRLRLLTRLMDATATAPPHSALLLPAIRQIHRLAFAWKVRAPLIPEDLFRQMEHEVIGRLTAAGKWGDVGEYAEGQLRSAELELGLTKCGHVAWGVPNTTADDPSRCFQCRRQGIEGSAAVEDRLLAPTFAVHWVDSAAQLERMRSGLEAARSVPRVVGIDLEWRVCGLGRCCFSLVCFNGRSFI